MNARIQKNYNNKQEQKNIQKQQRLWGLKLQQQFNANIICMPKQVAVAAKRYSAVALVRKYKHS